MDRQDTLLQHKLSHHVFNFRSFYQKILLIILKILNDMVYKKKQLWLYTVTS